MSKLSVRIKNHRTYQREYKMRRQILVGIIMVNLLIFVVGILCMKILPENAGKSMPEIIKYSVKLLVDSGGFMDNTTGILSVVLTVVIVIAGMICFTGGIIAYMSNAVTNLVDNADKGNNKIKLQNHIVIVNWNSKVPLLIADYLRMEERQYIVILTDKGKEEVLSEIDKKIHDLLKEEKANNNFGMKLPRVIVRNAQNLTAKDLDGICITDAASVLLVSPESAYTAEGCDAFVIKQYMLLISYLSDFLNADDDNDLANILGITVEIQLAKNLKYINDYPVPLDDNEETILPVGVNCNEILGKIMAISVVKPSLHSAVLELLSFQGSEICARVPIDEEYDYEDVEEHLVPFEKQLITNDYSIPLFELGDYYRALLIEDGNNYKYDDVFVVGKETLNLFEDTTDVDISKWKLKKKFEKRFYDEEVAIHKKILIIGENERLLYILNELVKFYPEGVTIALAYTDEEQGEKISNIISNDFKDTAIDVIDLSSDFSDETVCPCLEIYTDVLVLSDPNDEIIEDRIPVLFWNIVLRNKVEGKNLFIEVLNPENKDIVKSSTISGNYFISNQYMSGMFTQLGSDINLYSGIMELLTLKSNKNIWSYTVPELYKEDSIEFVSKKELVLWTYKFTSGKYLPIGVIKDGITCLLTNGMGINDARLLPANWDGSNGFQNSDVISLGNNDEIIVIER